MFGHVADFFFSHGFNADGLRIVTILGFAIEDEFVVFFEALADLLDAFDMGRAGHIGIEEIDVAFIGFGHGEAALSSQEIGNQCALLLLCQRIHFFSLKRSATDSSCVRIASS